MKTTVILIKGQDVNYDFDENDFVLYSEFGLEPDWENHEVYCEWENQTHNQDHYPINIDKILPILNQLKNQGSTHVSIDYNPDHYGYTIQGQIVSIKDEKQVEIDKQERLDTIRRERIEKIINELRDLDINSDDLNSILNNL